MPLVCNFSIEESNKGLFFAQRGMLQLILGYCLIKVCLACSPSISEKNGLLIQLRQLIKLPSLLPPALQSPLSLKMFTSWPGLCFLYY